MARKKVRLFDDEALVVLAQWHTAKRSKIKSISKCLGNTLSKMKDDEIYYSTSIRKINGLLASDNIVFMEKDDNQIIIKYSDEYNAVYFTIREDSEYPILAELEDIKCIKKQKVFFQNSITKALSSIPKDFSFYYTLLQYIVTYLEEQKYMRVGIKNTNKIYITTTFNKYIENQICISLLNIEENKSIYINLSHTHSKPLIENKRRTIE